MSNRFTSESAGAASKKRKTRFPRITQKLVSKKKDYKKLKSETKAVIQSWRANLYSGGSNNSIGFSGLRRVIDRMHETTPFTRRSVFVDFGCGCGTPCLYVSSRFRCKCIGIDYDAKLIEIAQGFQEHYDPEQRCTFETLDFMALTSEWLRDVGATHVFAFDGVFELENWSALFYDVIADVAGLTGASVSKFRRLNRGRKWPPQLELIGEPLSGIKLVGGTSGFSIGVWTC